MVGTQTGGLQDNYPGHFGFLVLVPAIHFLVMYICHSFEIPFNEVSRQTKFLPRNLWDI